MSQFIYLSRSNRATGCGCLLLVILLTIFLISLLSKLVWYFLPLIIAGFVGFGVYRWLMGNRDSVKRDDNPFYDTYKEDETVVKPNRRPIKQAEVIDEDD